MSHELTIAEALSVRAAISRKIDELRSERGNNNTVYVDKNETPEYPARSVDVITAELDVVQRDYRKLDVMIAQANLANTIAWDGGEITILEAIELAKQTRQEMSAYSYLGQQKKRERLRGGGTGEAAALYQYALYEPETYHQLTQKRTREVTKLSALIERANHMNMIAFDASKYMA
ncbi:hypothetical protein [Paenibacillus arenosi]|uniref:Uncharacterized protein n=1 Tax=Paenibacillus arenosi TaxID=2774142 RepID=A0ABR9B4I0_9BACL|nr:hypothetical protein [Paenibacillus arenosi]MBD8501224.1 hypothetical protein [Paenibacillus arenosi]